MHPSRDIVSTKSELLSGKTIILGVTGSIAAVKTIELCHELIRHGGHVIPIMTEAATRIIHPDALHYATGQKPILQLTGAVEHVELAGDRPDRADIYVIAPATANTISKIAHAIDDTPVTTVATTAIGAGMPVIVVPAMHSSMNLHPGVMGSITTLKTWGIEVIEPRIEEGKAKMASIESIVCHVVRATGNAPDLSGKKGLVISGPTTEMIDGFRAVTNLSTGESGRSFAKYGFLTGADIEHWHSLPPDIEHLESKHFKNVDDLQKLVSDARADFAFMAAAVGDFRPTKVSGKIPSDQGTILELQPTPKVIDELRNRVRYLVGFKAMVDVDDAQLKDAGYEKLLESNLDLVVANDVDKVGTDTTSCIIVRRDGSGTAFTGTKNDLARMLYEEIAKGLGLS